MADICDMIPPRLLTSLPTMLEPRFSATFKILRGLDLESFLGDKEFNTLSFSSRRLLDCLVRSEPIEPTRLGDLGIFTGSVGPSIFT